MDIVGIGDFCRRRPGSRSDSIIPFYKGLRLCFGFEFFVYSGGVAHDLGLAGVPTLINAGLASLANSIVKSHLCFSLNCLFLRESIAQVCYDGKGLNS